VVGQTHELEWINKLTWWPSALSWRGRGMSEIYKTSVLLATG